MAESGEHPMVVNWPANVGPEPSLDGRRLLWGTVLVVMLLDVATTYVGVQYGLTEGNRLVRLAMDTFGILGLLLIKGVVLSIAAVLAVSIPKRVTPIIPLGLILPTTIAVTINLAFVGML